MPSNGLRGGLEEHRCNDHDGEKRRASDQSRDQDDRYTRSLEDQVEYLRRQLDQERDANRENRRIDAALTSRIPELEASVERGPQRRRRIAREARGPTPVPLALAEGLLRALCARRSGGGGVGCSGGDDTVLWITLVSALVASA
jgi:hypothetical protein